MGAPRGAPPPKLAQHPHACPYWPFTLECPPCSLILPGLGVSSFRKPSWLLFSLGEEPPLACANDKDPCPLSWCPMVPPLPRCLCDSLSEGPLWRERGTAGMGAPRGEMALLLCSAPLTPASLHSVLLETHDTALSPAKSPVRDWKKAYFFFFWPCCVACGILVTQRGIEPWPPAVEVWSPNH